MAALIPVITFILYAITMPGLLRGEHAGLYVTAAALAERGGFAIDGQIAALAASDADGSPASLPRVAYFAGHYYVARPPGLAALATPLYLLGIVAAPLLGPEAPLIAVALLGPLLAALVSLGLVRSAARQGTPMLLLPIAVLVLGLPLHRTRPLALLTLLVAIGLASWAASLAARLLRDKPRPAHALALGTLLGSAALLDYGVGLIGGGALAILLALLLVRRRDLRSTLLAAIGAAVPLTGLLGWHTALFGAPWRAAFRVAVDPAERTIGALARASLPPAPAAMLAPIDWLRPPVLALVLTTAAIIGLLTALSGRSVGTGWRRAALPALLILALILPAPGLAATATDGATTENYAAPFATAQGKPVWALERAIVQGASLALEAGGRATSPWTEARPGLAYAVEAIGNGPLRVTFLWEDITRTSVGSQVATFGAGQAQRAELAAPIGAGEERRAAVAAPVGAAGLRLRFDAQNGPATVTGLRLTLVGGARVEPFPDGKRAALAFSFDWESAMGGLIHSRSAGGEGEGATVGLRADGGPSVAEAEARGLRMREGARALAALFARYGIRGTFYSTGYNLLPGNPGCQKFLGDPLYRNANQSNGWGSDWWRTHPWYGDDPCTTEEQAPAWYFASETRALAAAGHEIASHSFGHLYVRGVKPEELRADLELWNSAVRALGLPPARSFAFPWTSSNSLDETFWVVFEQVGMTILTRVYGPDVRHPYELARVKDAPNLIVFPDFYLASNAAALDEALARIDLTVASRGYHSLWNHPNETLEQQGQVVWQRAVDYAASQRERGLWIAPVSEIVEYGEAARRVNVTVLPLAGGTRLIVENRSGQRLEGITLGLPTAGTVAINGQTQGSTAAQTVILPALEPGAVVTVEVMR